MTTVCPLIGLLQNSLVLSFPLLSLGAKRFEKEIGELI
jgi:hypothetical protein